MSPKWLNLTISSLEELRTENPGTDLQRRRIELDRNIGTDPYQIPKRIFGDDCQNPITEDTEEIGNFDVIFFHPRVMSHPLLHATLSTTSPSLSSTSLVLLSSSSPYPDLLSMFKYAVRQNWEDLFLKVMKITCSVRQDLGLWSKNIKLDLSMIVSMRFSNKLMLKDWNYRTHNTDILNLAENKLDYKKNYQWKKNFSEKLQYERFMNWVRWRELKNYELTLLSTEIKSKSRHNTETHFTIAVYARTNEFYERFRRIPGSGIESQWKIVSRSLSSRSDSKFFLEAEPRQTLAIWYMERTWVTGKRFLVIHFLHWNILKEFIVVKREERQNQFHEQLEQGPLSQEMTSKIKAQFQCRCLREGLRPWVRQYRWKFHRVLWLDSRYRSCCSTNSLLHSLFYVVE